MFILDSLLVGGLRFVLDKVATVADQELNDPERWRAELLELQLRLENGEISEAEFVEGERVVLERLRALHPGNVGIVTDARDITSVEIDTGFDEDEDEEPRG